MNCPHCEVELRISERKSIEIDYCPKCRGVWLDRGELDKLLEASEREREPDEKRYEQRDGRDREQKPHYSKRKSFLGELFDF